MAKLPFLVASAALASFAAAAFAQNGETVQTRQAMIDGASQTSEESRSARSSFVGSSAAHATQTTTDSASAIQEPLHGSRLPTVYVAISGATLSPRGHAGPRRRRRAEA